jgi:ubiquinone/menaquinone biosynthesis C-methylase UbiE
MSGQPGTRAGAPAAARAPERDEWLPALGRLKGVEAYDRVLRVLSLDAIYEMLLDQLAFFPGDRVLDIGCGNGTLGSLMRRTRPEVAVTGLDRDPRMLLHAAGNPGSGDVSWIQGFAQRLPFGSGTFDSVTASLFLHHLTRAQKMEALGEANRVLRVGGSLHVADWTKPKPGISALGFTFVRLLDGFERTADHASGRIVDLIQGAGFQPVEHLQMRHTWLGTLGFYRATKA